MATDYLVYVGTYTKRDSEGLYVYRMDGSTGELEFSSKSIGIEEPSFLALSPDNRSLYVVSEVEEIGGQATGAVMAYAISSETGELSYLNRQLTGRDDPLSPPGEQEREIPGTGQLRLRQCRLLPHRRGRQPRRGDQLHPA